MANGDGATLTILERLERGETLVSDGASGTYLQAHGLEPGGSPEEFNVSRPSVLREMAAAYYAAGADMVSANSFGGNRHVLAKFGLGDRAVEVNRLAAQHARAVAPPGRHVVGSLGPTGHFLAPLGPLSEGEMFDAFAEQVAALREGGADGIVVETMSAIEEAVLAVRAARQTPGGLTVMATMTFDRTRRGFFTSMGVTPERAVHELFEAGAHVVGANCGRGVEDMVELARQLRRATDGFLLVQPNAGMPTLRDGRAVYSETPEWMAERFRVMADLGVNILGGCCGTTPEHIRVLAEMLRGA